MIRFIAVLAVCVAFSYAADEPEPGKLPDCPESDNAQIEREITPHFKNWLQNNPRYKNHVPLILKYSSFGGKENDDDKITRDPVVFVHGISSQAYRWFSSVNEMRKKHGYGTHEVYGVTWGTPGSLTQLFSCDKIAHIRDFMIAVMEYTSNFKHKIDVIAHSYGVDYSILAMQGGTPGGLDCDLGIPLGDYVDTFVGIAGPVHGAGGCIPGTDKLYPFACHATLGLYAGCEAGCEAKIEDCPKSVILAKMLKELTANPKMIAAHTFAIFNKHDEVIGNDWCGAQTSVIPGMSDHKIVDSNHRGAAMCTGWDQFNLIAHHKFIPRAHEAEP